MGLVWSESRPPLADREKSGGRDRRCSMHIPRKVRLWAIAVGTALLSSLSTAAASGATTGVTTTGSLGIRPIAASAGTLVHVFRGHSGGGRSEANKSNNWSGYNQGLLETGHAFNAITADWTVPRASPHKRGE